MSKRATSCCVGWKVTHVIDDKVRVILHGSRRIILQNFMIIFCGLI